MSSKAKATVSLPVEKSKGNSRAQPLSGKAKGKKPARDEDQDMDDGASLSGFSNASGFSGSDEDEGQDEFDVEDMSVEEEGGEEDEEMNTEDEIEMAKAAKPKSKKNTKKRKLPTSADTFGATLASLLGEAEAEPSSATTPSEPTAAPPTKRRKPSKPVASTSNPILSLSARPLPQTSAQESLERKAQKALKAAKEEKEDRARVKNVLEGWAPTEDGAPGGQEWERGLRKVAQRGVIKLFNAILQASSAHPTLTGSAAVNNERQSRKEKDNILGRGGKEERLTKEGFLDMIKSGGR